MLCVNQKFSGDRLVTHKHLHNFEIVNFSNVNLYLSNIMIVCMLCAGCSFGLMLSLHVLC